ncbi:MAG: MarR family transcriptional regulator [Chloroflexota bacterium]|nr:MarR family transcriptional regulator [Chloroflexota bacterium]
MSNSRAIDPSVGALLRAYLDAVTLSEPLQGRIWRSSQLTLTQVRALRRLAKTAKPLGELGAELGLTPPSVTRVVDRLEERGLIERRRDPVDRRKVVASILPAGLGLVTSVPLLEQSAIRTAAERLEPAARGRIAAALEEFARAVRSEETEPEGDAVPAS